MIPDSGLYHNIDVGTRFGRDKIWYDLVSEYSRRKFTKSRDKLPALSGIADNVRSITKDSYIAGHWKQELDRSLVLSIFSISSAVIPSSHLSRAGSALEQCSYHRHIHNLQSLQMPDPGRKHRPINILALGGLCGCSVHFGDLNPSIATPNTAYSVPDFR